MWRLVLSLCFFPVVSCFKVVPLTFEQAHTAVSLWKPGSPSCARYEAAADNMGCIGLLHTGKTSPLRAIILLEKLPDDRLVISDVCSRDLHSGTQLLQAVVFTAASEIQLGDVDDRWRIAFRYFNAVSDGNRTASS